MVRYPYFGIIIYSNQYATPEQHGAGSAEDGISEVVGFVIILAVVVAGISLYLTYAVPVQGREDEIREMDGVRAWFVDYKTGMDQLWLQQPARARRHQQYR